MFHNWTLPSLRGGNKSGELTYPQLTLTVLVTTIDALQHFETG